MPLTPLRKKRRNKTINNNIKTLEFRIMKKLFIAMMAMAAFAACSNEEPVASLQGDAIAFGDAFVDNAVRAIYGENGHNLTAIKVWGNVKQTNTNNTPVALYGTEGATVSGGAYGALWSCNVVRYWTPSCDFNFLAIAHGTVATNDVVNGIPTKISYTANGDDLLLATPVVATTDNSGAPITGVTTVQSEKVVAFTMNHLLSRIAFKFANNAGNADYKYNVTGIKVYGTYTSGVYTITPGQGETEGWGSQAGSLAEGNALTFNAITGLAFGATTAAEGAYVIIPGDPKLTITFNTEVVFNGAVIGTTPHTITLNQTPEDTDKTFAPNTSYTFTVELPKPGAEIKFSVSEVSGFGNQEATIQ